MILYDKDKESASAHIFDLETRNTSFLEYAFKLRDEGVVNWNFCLVLFNKELIGIDPHSNDLNEHTKIAIVQESYLNPWYFFREVVRVATPYEKNGVRMKATKISITMIWLYFNKIHSVFVAHRQVGKTIPIKAIFSWVLLLDHGHKGTILSAADMLAINNISGIYEFIKLLPSYFNKHFLEQVKLTKTPVLVYKILCNAVTGRFPPKDDKQAGKLYRGESIQSVFVDNATDIPHLNTILDNVIPCTSSINTNVDIYGDIIITTRSGEVSDKYPRVKWVYENLIKNSPEWNNLIFDTESNKVLKENLANHYLVVTTTHKELGFSDKWLKDRIDSSMISDDDYKNEWSTVWQLPSSDKEKL